MPDQDVITFGAVHLEVRDPERTAYFWEELFGFQRRVGGGSSIAVGTAEETLLVLNGGARVPFQKGHSGIYHVAIHPPNARDFARIFKRLIDHKYPMSPTDHTFSRSIYLDDPDGINIEITLETPERFKECIPGPGNRLTFVGADGVGRPGAYALDLDEVFQPYEAGSESEPAANGTKVGHIHLYVANLEQSRNFYTGLGMELARWWPPMQIADLGAGGPFKHRIAINTWQGIGAPPSPAGTARMRHFEMRFATSEHLQAALAANPAAVDVGSAYEVTDPSGIRLRLAKAPTYQSAKAAQELQSQGGRAMPENAYRVSRVIALEEHAWSPELRKALLRFDPDETITAFSNQEPTSGRLLEAGDERLARMDAAGVDVQVLSITAPGTQQLPREIAVPVACDANDFLADAVQRNPDRFRAFATLPTPDPDAAAVELRRCIHDLNFVGAMLFPRSGSVQLDHSSFRPIFEAAAELKVPLYLHPGLPPKAIREACYAGFEPMTNLMLATGGWGWHAEAGLSALRLILAGTFDRHPDLQLILGHWGEMLVPFADRADALTKTTHLERPVGDYITGNVYVTAGGVFSHRMLRQNLDVLGPDRIMIGVDDPFSSTLGQKGKKQVRSQRESGFVRTFIETAPLNDEEKSKLAHRNAERLLFRDDPPTDSG